MVKNLNTIDRGTKIRLGRWHNDDQADNTIVINASDTPINASNANALYMKPIRSDPSNNTIMTGFDPNSFEILDTGLRRDDIAPREVDYYANIGNTFTSTIKFEGDTSLTTEGVVGIANVQPIHTLDVGTKFYVDENGANVLTVLGDTYVQDDVVIGGNLDVRGTLTTIDTENTTIKDAIVEIGKGNTLSDVGFIMNRPGSNVAIGYRDSVDEFVIAHTDSSANSTTIVPSGELIDVRVHGHLHTNSSLSVDTNLLHVDAISDRVGINTLFPQSTLDVIGDAKIASNLTVGTDGLYVDTVNSRVGINTLTPSTDFHVEGETYVSGNVTVDTDTLHVDTVNDRVGINTLSPTTDFHVEGDTYVSGNVDVQTNLNVLTDAIVTGNVDVQTDLNVIGNVYTTSNIVTTGNVDVHSELNVTGNAFVSSNAVVAGNVVVQSELNVLGNAEIQTDLTVVGNAYASSNVIVTGNVDVQTDLNVVGNAYASSNVIVTGNVDVQTDLNVVGNAYLTSNAVITGNADVQTDLNVVGNAYLTSNAVITGNADVQTNLNVAADAVVTGNVDVQTDLNITGNVYASSNIVTTGNVDVQQNLNVATDAIVTGNVDVQTDLNITGNVYASSNIVTTGNVDVQQNLNVATDAVVTGNVDVQTDLTIVGNVYATSNIVTTGNVDVQTDLNVMGNAYVSSNAIVTGNVDVQSDLNVTGDAYVTTYYGDGGLLSNVNLQVVSDHGNATSTTVRLTNATTGLVTTSNVEVGDQISIGNLTANKIPIVGTGNFLENSAIGRSNGTIVISSDLEVLGNIVVDGNSYAIESNNLVINDRIIGIANNNVSHELDIGIIMQHPGKNIALIHHGEAQGDSDPHDHTFTIGYTQNTVVDNHVFDDSNLITVEILGNLITQNNLTVSENITVVGTTLLQDSVGIANTAPIHDLDVGSNLYVDDQGSNVLHVTGNVYASRFVGDGALLTNIASNLHEITTNGNVTTNTVQFDGSTALVTTGKVGIANTAPIHNLDVGSNLYVDDQGSNVLHVTGNVYASRFVGDGALLTTLVTTGKVGISNANPTANLHVTGTAHVSGELEVLRLIDAGQFSRTRIGSGSGGGTQNTQLNQIAIGENSGYNSQRTDAIAIGQEAGHTGQGTDTVAIGHNAGHTDQQPNAVAIGLDAGNDTQGQGSIAIGDSAGELTQNDFSVAIGYRAGSNNQGRMAVAIGTSAGQTDQPDNSIVINASGQGLNGSISNAFYVAPIRENSGTSLLTYNPTSKEITQNNTLSNTLTVTNGLVTNLGGLTKKTYGYSAGTITASTTPEINVVFDSQLFSAKITAHLVEPTSNISVLNLDVTGGTGRNIGKGFLNIIGDQNSKHWNSAINTTDTTVTLTPSVGLLSDGTYGVHVEYTSPLGTGGVTSIDKNNTNEITFDY